MLVFHLTLCQKEKIVKIHKLIWTLLIACSLVACARTKPIESPDFTVLAKSSAHVEKAIRHALAGRGWKVLSHRPGEFVAMYKRGAKYSAEIAIRYSKKNVSIQYRDSQGLLYDSNGKSGQAEIHRTYNNWIHYLERDINSNLIIM